MTDLSTLEAERKRISDAIAALSSDLGRPLPGRKLPSAAGGKVEALKRQLAVVELKLKQAKAGSEG